jgi:hypothetical protein
VENASRQRHDENQKPAVVHDGVLKKVKNLAVARSERIAGIRESGHWFF